MTHFKMACYLFISGFLFASMSCAPSPTTRSDSSLALPSGSTTAPKGGGNDRGVGEGQSGASRESTTPAPSSLDQLREGKSSATPAVSPLKDVYFEYDRYDLRGDARDVLRANADWLKSNAATRVEIEGHCDDRGTNEYNLALGAKRAQAAKDYLATLGVASERLSTISYGAEIPVCKEPSENCWRQNRRARFVILSSKPAS